jgi:DNA-directed RNA polymerase specialized sigma24 family protein
VEFHDPEEFAAAMDALTRIEKIRLRKAQQIFARPPLVDGDDLLQELYSRVFGGTRHWRVGEDVLTFATQAMRSFAHEATEKSQRESVTLSPGFRQAGDAAVAELGFANRDGVVGTVHQSITPEDNLVAADERKLLESYRQSALASLDGDDAAQLLLEGMCDGLKGRKLQDLTGLGGTEFASKQTLVRRRLEKLGQDDKGQRRSA